MDRMSTKGQMIDQIDLRNVPHSAFDRSHHNFQTMRLGGIVPKRLDEVYPGDMIKGSPEVVCNFEPLAAPIMGSMVHKQEAFFVPYIQLWRHSYKFFTGKGDFDDPMPSISPLNVFNTFAENGVHLWWYHSDGFLLNEMVSNLKAYVNDSSQYSVNSSSGNNFKDDFESDFLNEIEHNLSLNYVQRKMYDLVEPIIKHIESFKNSDELIQLSDDLENPSNDAATRLAVCVRACVFLGDLIKDYFNFFHGVSSIFDYLGWPTPLPEDFELPESVITSLGKKLGITHFFQYVLYLKMINGTGRMAEWDYWLEKIFSQVPLNFMPFKAYYLIWYWNYRDQLLETGILDPEEDEFLGTNITSNVIMYCCMLRQRCWFKDTFTTALTNTGDGNLLVPVQDRDDSITFEYYDDSGHLINTTDRNQAVAAGANFVSFSSNGINYQVPMNYLRGSNDGNTSSRDDYFISLDVFDRIKRLRSYVQKRFILGYEVDDVVWSSFMVRMSNVRMHIPEILSRGRDAVDINTIVNNTNVPTQIAGDKTAIAWAHGKGSNISYFAEEWGLYLELHTVMPIQDYAAGMQRLYFKRDRFDYMWPEFATMGMDAVYNFELAALGTRLNDEQGLQVFGYQGRYYDLKSRQNEQHGRLLTDLNYLTFTRMWDRNNPPKLNYQFVHCWPKLDAFVVSDPTVDLVRCDCYSPQGWQRRLPVPSEIVG